MAKQILAYVPADDGYTFDGFLEGVEHQMPDIRFTYRPLISEERSEFIDALKGKKGRDQDREIAKKLSERIKSWDLKDGRGETLPITRDTVRRLQFPTFNRLSGIVIYGSQISDQDPKWDEPDRDETHGKTADEALDANLGN